MPATAMRIELARRIGDRGFLKDVLARIAQQMDDLVDVAEV